MNIYMQNEELTPETTVEETPDTQASENPAEGNSETETTEMPIPETPKE